MSDDYHDLLDNFVDDTPSQNSAKKKKGTICSNHRNLQRGFQKISFIETLS